MIEINCQSSIKISEDKIIYFDPIKVRTELFIIHNKILKIVYLNHNKK